MLDKKKKSAVQCRPLAVSGGQRSGELTRVRKKEVKKVRI